ASAVYTLLVTLLVYRLVVSRLSPGALGVWSVVSSAVAFGRLSDFALSAAHLRSVAVAASEAELRCLRPTIVRNALRAMLMTLALVCITAPLMIWASFDLLLQSTGKWQLIELFTVSAAASLLGSAGLVVA